ncbi:DNA topoisomerase 2 [Spinacia oleracea]|uniref:DNA topoisomerase (ATP-hydrolyzing) n=1 Tax=Spinacia oleracea TaxID=3562 RepID=A0A9R0IV65_SPIOL|nr:DNA topoisomerase 2-like [Spinacia oleracea]
MGDIVPSMVDGLKESERILLLCALKKHGFKEVEVEQLAKDSYMFTPRAKYPLHKRMASIFRMAQASAGNINLFVPISDSGSLYGGVLPVSDLSFGIDLIKLNPITRMMFQQDDYLVAMKILKCCEGCGSLPTFLLPIIPLILVNGTDCTVSGYRSYVPKYRPKDIIANLRCLLKKEDMKPMIPWFKGFKGTVEVFQDDNAKFMVSGVIDNIDHVSKTVEVTELPIGILAQDYIKLLEDGSIPNKGFVDSSDYHNQSLCLRVSLRDEDCKMDAKHLLERLKLNSVISLNDMYLVNASQTIWKYNSPLEVLHQFYDFRLQFFVNRKEFLIKRLTKFVPLESNA